MLNRSDLINIAKLLAVIWVGLAVVVVIREIAGSLTLRDWHYDAIADLSNITTRMWMPWLVMSPLLVIVIKRFLFFPDRWLHTLVLHLFFVMGFIFVHLAGVSYHYQIFEPDKVESMRVYAGWEHMGHFLVADPFVLTDFIIYVLFVASFNMSNYIQLVKQKEQDTNQLQASLMESKLHALQMQVNPHFLFNTLNSISVLVQKKDFASAGEMIHRLSDFFRMTLEKTGDQLVPLESELELTDNYLAIEQMRFKDRLTIIRDIDSRTLPVNVPAMILQPLVENSLRHGINGIDGHGQLTLRSRYLADRILLQIIDNGPGLDGIAAGAGRDKIREGIGLSNVQARLRQLYGESHVFSIKSGSPCGTVVAIEIPIVESVETATAETLNLNDSAARSLQLIPGRS